jgi:hypothetical protein
MSTYVNMLAKKLGIRMEDAAESMSIEVFPRDIKKAIVKNNASCALSVAARRQLHASGAIFFRSTAWLLTPGVLRRYVLSPTARAAIRTFDKTGVFEQGTYVLYAPQKSRRLDAALARSKKRPGRHEPRANKIKRKPVSRERDADVRTATLPSMPHNWLPERS